MANPTIGFIGLGIMGKPMARNLMKAGYPLVVHNRSRTAVDELSKEGAQTSRKFKGSRGIEARYLLLCFRIRRMWSSSIWASKASLPELRPGMLLIDMSSISPIVARKLAADAQKRGMDMLDAPVSGGEAGAISATLSIMIGGKAYRG